MSVRSVTVTTPPTVEPVILAEAKAWAKIDSTEDDALIAALITAAIESAQQYTRRAFITQTLKLTIDLPCGSDNWQPGVFDAPITADLGDMPNTILLPRGPIQSITSVVTYDLTDSATTMDSSYYRVDTASGRFLLKYNQYWPSNMRSIGAAEITYVAGYGNTSSSVPMPIKTAILMHVQTMYDGRIVCEMPEQCKQLLNQYRIIGDGMR